MRASKILIPDLILFGLTAFVALLIRENTNISWTYVTELIPFVLIGIPTAAVSFMLMGTHRGLWEHVSSADTLRIISSVLMAVAMTMFVMFAFNRLDGVSRTIPLLQIPLLILSMLGARYFVRSMSRHAIAPLKATSAGNGERENVLIVGLSYVTELYIQCVGSMAMGRIHIEGVLEEDSSKLGRLIHFTKVIGQPKDLTSLLGMFNVHGVTIDRIVVTVPFTDLSDESREILLRYEKSGTIKLDLFEERLGFGLDVDLESKQSAVFESSAVERVIAKPTVLDNQYEFLKRAMDLVGSAMLILLLAPVFVIVSLLVAYDVGVPLIFWQQRPGKRGKPFRVLKFRTMRAGHDRQGNIIPDKDRTSFIGHLLRRARMDELPQLYHILIGQMSFVGPRPLLMKYQPEARGARLSVRPGVTGWAQINGGNLLSAEEKNVLDMWYLRNASLLLDLKIIFRTLQIAAQGNGDILNNRNRAAIRMAFSDYQRAIAGDQMEILISKPSDAVKSPNEEEAPGDDKLRSDGKSLSDDQGRWAS